MKKLSKFSLRYKLISYIHHKMIIKKLSSTELGKHYGYPDCCISDFVKEPDIKTINQSNLRSRQKYQHLYGYLPCNDCFIKLENNKGKININSLLTDRKCSNPLTEKKEDLLNYYDEISQNQSFLIELEMLIRKTAKLMRLPYINVLRHEQILFLINPKRMFKKKISNERYMRYHLIKNVHKLLKL